MNKELFNFESLKECLLEEKIRESHLLIDFIADQSTYSRFNNSGKLLEASEIEKIFCISFMFLAKVDSVSSTELIHYFNVKDNQFRIEKEVQIGPYRVDFICYYEKLLFNPDKKIMSSVVIECDSQEWHERTEQQRQYEKKRDRFIQKNGFHVFRFTGRELMEKPLECAREVMDFLIRDVNKKQ